MLTATEGLPKAQISAKHRACCHPSIPIPSSCTPRPTAHPCIQLGWRQTIPTSLCSQNTQEFHSSHVAQTQNPPNPVRVRTAPSCIPHPASQRWDHAQPSPQLPKHGASCTPLRSHPKAWDEAAAAGGISPRPQAPRWREGAERTGSVLLTSHPSGCLRDGAASFSSSPSCAAQAQLVLIRAGLGRECGRPGRGSGPRPPPPR